MTAAIPSPREIFAVRAVDCIAVLPDGPMIGFPAQHTTAGCAPVIDSRAIQPLVEGRKACDSVRGGNESAPTGFAARNPRPAGSALDSHRS
jgi:hypothetical protein